MRRLILDEIEAFLGCPTPKLWLEKAVLNLPDLLVDHAQCEKKAASSALQIMFRYPEDEELANAMSKLAREELRHFEQVLRIMQSRGIHDRRQNAARYAAELNRHIRKSEPGRLIDSLVVGAFIEARSCERFAGLVPMLDDSLALFYGGLLESEGRHYKKYLALARARWLSVTGRGTADRATRNGHGLAESGEKDDLDGRIIYFRNIERDLIESNDDALRFHSGLPY